MSRPLAYRALLVGDGNVPPAVRAAAAFLREEMRRILAEVESGEFTTLANDYDARRAAQRVISDAVRAELHHPGIESVEGDVLVRTGDPKAVVYLSGSREAAANLDPGNWLQIICIDEYRVDDPAAADVVSDDPTGYTWRPGGGWELNPDMLGLYDDD